MKRRRRSALYMPASNARAIAKARGLACDVVILDLEDAVSPEKKVEAREAAVAAVREGGWGGRELVVRCNARDSAWGEDDLRVLAQARPDALLAPKVDGAADVAAYLALAGGLPLWAMVETARGIVSLPSLAAAEGLAALVIGTNDLAKELGCEPGADRLPLQSMLTAAVVAARANGLAVLDGVFNGIEDAQGLAAECAQARRFGFDGKTLIHPSQVEACNAAFAPDEAAVRWARAVVSAFEEAGAAGRGAIRVEGQMVELLHLDQARAILAEVGGTEGASRT